MIISIIKNVSRTHGNVFKCLYFSNQQSKTQMYSVYYHRGQRKAEKVHILEAGTSKF